MDLLVVVPHPDDESFGAGGALLLAKEAGLKTGVLTLTRGKPGEPLASVPRRSCPRCAWRS